MKRANACLCAGLLSVTLSAGYAAEQTRDDRAEVALQAALKKENVDGDLKGAIEQYRKIAQTAGNRSVAAKALIRMGQCYEKLGSAEARKAYERVLRDYADQTDMAADARTRLAALGQSGAPLQTMRMTRLTHTGNASAAAISPDGKYVTYSVRDGGKESLWLRQIATSRDVQIVPSAEVRYPTPTFSHDGNYIYYADSRILYQVPVRGGTPRQLMVDVGSYYNSSGPVTFSPDGKQLAFVRYSHKAEEYEAALTVANADGTGARKLATRKRPGSGFRFPAWSPDGKTIAVAAYLKTDEVNIVAVPTGGGSERIIGQKWAQMCCLAWVFDGSGLVVVARKQLGSDSPEQLWQLSYPSGEARRITNDLNSYGHVSLTRDGTVLATVQSETDSSLWVVPQSGPTHARQLTPTTYKHEGLGGLAWTPDGRLVTVGGSWLWIRDADGSNPRQLTPQGSYSFPAISPDGKTIVFARSRAIWRMDTDGGNLKRLTRGDSDCRYPDISPDGKWVSYVARHSGKSTFTLSRVPIDGGEPVELAPNLSNYLTPSISPDGTLIAFGIGEIPNRRVAIMPFEGGEPIKTLDLPSVPNWIIRWTPDGQAIAYVDRRNGASNIWSQPLSGGPSQQLTQFTSDNYYIAFAWSRDGKQLALSRATTTNDVVLITNFR